MCVPIYYIQYKYYNMLTLMECFQMTLDRKLAVETDR